MTEITQQQALRNNITYDMFVDSADQNYVVARWCFQQGLALDFLWNATHCLEKLMKAVLLMNGRSTISSAPGQRPFGHDLSSLYPEVAALAGDLLPDLLIQPTEIDMHWRVETTGEFVGRISANGDAHNRYQIYGHTLHREDLYKLDRVVFAIRRLCCPLGSYLFGNVRLGQPQITFRDQLGRQPGFMPHMAGSRWQKLTDHRAPEELRHAALNHNLIFAPDYEHGELRCGSSSLNPVLGRRILQADRGGVSGQHAAEIVELVDWVVQNIYLPSSVRQQLFDARDRLAART
ncbi:hypothetical protein CVM52_06100 [Pseudooceanicola lipolyticus]|uniref:HEPN domain-containing protein n=1 Tax=Pseudooceanicola lipolyticus TaxID=2029104 RepID=A0A2M8J461_9RHOB|nr:hypothetical protein [Pseudooceanicola lipolyticus]MCC0027235.1 hypothetical protein [Brucellaceae bacterium]PJE37565.1 hypothetical protein CVM52_06100 [Pseudooceanicola lipolyticus]